MSRDAVHEQATLAWAQADGLRRELLHASLRTADSDAVLTALVEVWAIWPKLQRAMAALEALTPHSVAAGQAKDEPFVALLKRTGRMPEAQS